MVGTSKPSLLFLLVLRREAILVITTHLLFPDKMQSLLYLQSASESSSGMVVEFISYIQTIVDSTCDSIHIDYLLNIQNRQMLLKNRLFQHFAQKTVAYSLDEPMTYKHSLFRQNANFILNYISNIRMWDQQKKIEKSLFCINEARGDTRKNRFRKDKSAGPSIFISKTFEILENSYYHDVAAWNEEGSNFTILDVDRFEQEVLPIYFRHRNFSSFVRQLNMYDFHKIRNEYNKSIFEHKQFRRGAKHLLKNIKRKGSNNKKGGDNIDEVLDSQSSSLMEEQDDYFPDQKSQNIRNTVESIQKLPASPMPSLKIIPQKQSQSPYKNLIIDQFVSNLPEALESDEEIKQIIIDMKNDSKFECLNSREDIRKIIKRIRRRLQRKKKYSEEDLEELSIEEEIMVHNIDGQQISHPTLAILTSQNYLPARSIGFIGSLIL